MDSLKPVALLLLLTCLFPSLSVYCQTGGDPTVTLSVTNSPLEKVLKDINKQTGYTYLGDAIWPQLARKVTISVTKMPIRQVLDLCFADQPLYYELVGNAISIQEKKANGAVVHGKVSNTKNEAVPGATIQSRGRGGRPVSAVSNENGEFVIHLSEQDTSLIFSSINYETRQVRMTGDKELLVELSDRIGELRDVSVVPSNGYQKIPQERATGSFTAVGRELIGRRVSTNILDRLDGVTSSVLFNKNPVPGTNQSAITIRGRSTIFGSPDPVIVIDNFPYSGDINNLNPDDVESITILKDAAAASIWGAFSGNGVIVITTKKGKYNQAPKLSFNTSLTYGKKPGLYYTPVLSSSDYIDVEQFLFQKKYYSNAEVSPQHPFLSPAVEVMIKARDGGITEADAQAQLDLLRKTDVRQDLDRYFYRGSLNSQYSLNLSGGSAKNSYYFSAGYDKNVSNAVRNGYQRVTLDGNNTYCLIPKKLEFTTGLSFTHSTTQNNNSGNFIFSIPYLKLADAQGNALNTPNVYRQSYIDTVGGGKLLDWSFKPLDELRNADVSTRLQDYRINIGIKYAIWKGLDAHASYQYGHGSTDYKNLQSLQMYHTRDLINQYTQIDSAGNVTNPIPVGGILDETLTDYDANNIRLQLSYDHVLGKDHRLTALLGTELRDVEMKYRISRIYGYDPARQNGIGVDYVTAYPQYNSPGLLVKIENPDHITLKSDRYLSYYFNAAYTYKARYIFSASARRDESNLFGVDANKRGVPLWSLGAAWDLSKEDFYRVDWLPMLKLRVTDGYNGNVDRSVSAYATASINPGTNTYGDITAAVNNPPNPGLRWERINIFNIGLDFASNDDRVGGSLEYYIKAGRDLIGRVPIDPTTGNTVFTGNTANMRANGIDLNLHIYNDLGAFRWNSTLLFSYVRDKVTNYEEKLGAIRNYLNAGSISPLPGRPLYSVYALKWEGLDPQNGDPQGLLGGHVSKDYSSIFNLTNSKDLLYKGPANPPFFGSLRNDLFWKQFGLSFNIVYKLGYYFRRNSIQYNSLFNGNSAGHPDYDRRWQKTGDEQHTNVPSLSYPGDQTRDDFYGFSEALVEKGDHIRLQDLQFSYALPKKAIAPLHFQTIRFYCYANNIGILWKANHQGIDPDNVMTIPNPKTIALGLKLEF